MRDTRSVCRVRNLMAASKETPTSWSTHGGCASLACGELKQNHLSDGSRNCQSRVVTQPGEELGSFQPAFSPRLSVRSLPVDASRAQG